MNSDTRILIVDRDKVASASLVQTLQGLGFEAVAADSSQAAHEAMDRDRSRPQGAGIGVLIVDQDAFVGKELVQALQEDRPSLVPIMISGFRKVESAVAAMRLGAADYLLKPIVEKELSEAVERAVQRYLLLVERETAQADPNKPASKQSEDPQAEPSTPRSEACAGDWQPMPLAEAMKAPERQILLAALEANAWNRQETARQLEINRTTLYKKIRQYRLDEPA